MTNTIELCDWKVHWRLTESAGIAIYLANYKGRRVLWEGSLPFVVIDHQVDHQRDDSEETSHSHGPFWVPLGARTLAEPVRTNEFRGGFEIAADFVAGPFRYTQLWRFHKDGRLGPWLTIYGNGVHDSHTYHPHWRFDFDIDGSQHDVLQIREDNSWKDILSEGWFPAEMNDDGAQWRQIDRGTKASISIRPHHREDAELYALRYNDGEWPPFTPHGPSGQAFPAAFVGEEKIQDEDVTLWYVGHVHYDHSFPFTAGPWLEVRKK